MEYDVIVAGAGPAGSTAARECAARGLRVALLDKASFPRDKPCGGGISPHTADLLPFGVEPVTERVIRGMYVSVRERHAFGRRSEEPLGYLTQRSRLDTYLVEHAVRAGADLRERSPVRAVEQDAGGVTVRTGSDTLRGQALVAADGSNGQSARLAGIDVSRWLAVALEGNITPRGPFPAMWRDAFGMDIGGIPGGYGWIFPKGDHLNIGLGGIYGVGPTLRSRLENLTRFYGFQPADLWGTRGHPLPVRRSTAPLYKGRVALVGDAAGLVDPLSGEGIYYAVRSAGAAARAIHDFLDGRTTSLDGYRRELEEQVLPNLHDGLQIHHVFHLAPGIYAQLVRRSPWAWQAVRRIVVGELAYTHIKNRYAPLRLAIDVLADSARLVARRRGWTDGPEPEGWLRYVEGLLPPVPSAEPAGE